MTRCPQLAARPPDRGGSNFAWLLAQIRAGLFLGRLGPGDRLPSVRGLARRLRISPTTALDLYRALESEGMVRGRERSGVFLRTAMCVDEDGGRDRSAFLMVAAVARQIGLKGIAPLEFTRMLSRCTGTERRHDFTVAFVGQHESFELVERQVASRLGFRLPFVHVPSGLALRELRLRLDRDPSIGCVLTALLELPHVQPMAEDLGLPLVPLRLAPTAAALFEYSESRRYVIVRDRETASSLRQTACHLARVHGWLQPCQPADDRVGCRQCDLGQARQAPGVSFAALDEELLLADVDAHAEAVHAPMTALTGVRGRYGHHKRVIPMTELLRDDTIEELLFQYVCGRSRVGQTCRAVRASS